MTKFHNFFYKTWNFLSFSDFIFLYRPVKTFRLQNGLLDSFRRLWNGSEDFKLTNCSNNSIKFEIVFKFFESFCHFLAVINLSGLMKLFKVLHMCYWTDPKDKRIFEHIVTAKFKNFCINFAVFNILNVFVIFLEFFFFLRTINFFHGWCVG